MSNNSKPPDPKNCKHLYAFAFKGIDETETYLICNKCGNAATVSTVDYILHLIHHPPRT